MNANSLPKLPLENWIDSKITLHLYLQIVGKIRLSLHPKMNHWWHVTYYPTINGLTTGPIPYKNKLFSIDFDFVNHCLLIRFNQYHTQEILLNNLSVATFYESLMSILESQGIVVKILSKPFDPSTVMSDIPFTEDDQHASYDKEYISNYGQIIRSVYPILSEFRGRFIGKSTPVHLYWHTFDLAVTRFSGRQVPVSTELDSVAREAYSHEVISFGMWAGDKNIPEPAFYSYTYPEPKGLSEEPLLPSAAYWKSTNGSSLAILKYHDLIKMNNYKSVLLEFFESAYLAGAKLAGWDIEKFKLK